MAKNPKESLKILASTKVLQLLIAILFLAMGMLGFATGSGTGGQLSRELSNMFGGDREILLYTLSTIELVCGLVLAATLFVPSIPPKFVKISMTAIWIIWIALIVILDVLTIDFGRFDGSEWLAWIEQVALHLIVLAAIITIEN